MTKHATLQNALKTKIAWEADAPGGDTNLFETAVGVALTVTNAGTFPGTYVPSSHPTAETRADPLAFARARRSEIVQLYLQMPGEAENPARILRRFEAVDVPVGQSARVKLYLTRKDISYWNVSVLVSRASFVYHRALADRPRVLRFVDHRSRSRRGWCRWATLASTSARRRRTCASRAASTSRRTERSRPRGVVSCRLCLRPSMYPPLTHLHIRYVYRLDE